eukprot:scaffold37061_cov22-Tisochrysis_lutea.AAC.3
MDPRSCMQTATGLSCARQLLGCCAVASSSCTLISLWSLIAKSFTLTVPRAHSSAPTSTRREALKRSACCTCAHGITIGQGWRWLWAGKAVRNAVYICHFLAHGLLPHHSRPTVAGKDLFTRKTCLGAWYVLALVQKR